MEKDTPQDIHSIMSRAEIDLQTIRTAIGEAALKERVSCDDYHRKIDWEVAKRFLHIIYLYGPLKKTRLAMKTGVNSSSCARYITWFMEIDWVSMTNSDEFKLTEAGVAVCKRIGRYGTEKESFF
jgi:predicted transcriptional regulator